MRFCFCIFLLLSLFNARSQSQKTIELSNVNFFQNGKFEFFQTVFVKNGLFTFKRPATIDTTINLKGKFLIPPFAEGHTHKLDDQATLKKESDGFIKQGVFYAQVLNNFSSRVSTNRRQLNSPLTVDVLYANGGLTTTGQHPSFAYERILSGISDWWLPNNREKIKSYRKAENDAYWFMDSPKDVDSKWNAYLKTEPDVVKVYLMNVKANASSATPSLSQQSLNKIVEKARAAKLKVIAHVETIDDLKMAINAGISSFAHMPYYNGNFTKELPSQLDLSKKEKALIKKMHAVVIPTLSFNDEFSIVRNEKNNYQGEFDSANFKRMLAFQKLMIKELLAAGFQLSIGSDRDLFLPELLYWHRCGILPPAQILTIATYDTPQRMFPGRKLARLKEGYEASLLVLTKNPLEDFSAVQSIELRMKQGYILK